MANLLPPSQPEVGFRETWVTVAKRCGSDIAHARHSRRFVSRGVIIARLALPLMQPRQKCKSKLASCLSLAESVTNK